MLKKIILTASLAGMVFQIHAQNETNCELVARNVILEGRYDDAVEFLESETCDGYDNATVVEMKTQALYLSGKINAALQVASNIPDSISSYKLIHLFLAPTSK